jgi:protein TilB
LNFIPTSALPAVASLRPCYDLRELHLLGNPCTRWSGYRAYVVACLPQLTALDGEAVSAEERVAAEAVFPELEADLKAMNERGKGIDGCGVDEEGLNGSDRQTQSWCPATRVQDQR